MNIEELVSAISAKSVNTGDTLYAITYDLLSDTTCVYAGPLDRPVIGRKYDSVILESSPAAEGVETDAGVLVVTYQDGEVTSRRVHNAELYDHPKTEESYESYKTRELSVSYEPVELRDSHQTEELSGSPKMEAGSIISPRYFTDIKQAVRDLENYSPTISNEGIDAIFRILLSNESS